MDELWEKIKGEDNIHLKLIVSVVVIGFIFVSVHLFQGNVVVQEFFGQVEQSGWKAPFIYTLLYILISGILIPSIVFKIFAGTLFGILEGVLVISVASTISSMIKFLLARYFFRQTISKKVNRKQNLKAIDSLIERDGWKVLVLLRNVPVINGMFLNYICGVTKMSLNHFVWASFLGRLPTTFMYVYLGYLVGYTSGLETKTGVQTTMEWAMLFIGLAATIGVSYYVFHLSKKILSERVPRSAYSV